MEMIAVVPLHGDFFFEPHKKILNNNVNTAQHLLAGDNELNKIWLAKPWPGQAISCAASVQHTL